MNNSLFYNHNLIFHYTVLYGFGKVFDSITFDKILIYCVFFRIVGSGAGAGEEIQATTTAATTTSRHGRQARPPRYVKYTTWLMHRLQVE